MLCCLVCDEKRRVVGSRPTNGLCSICGGSMSDVRMRNMFRFCFIPAFWSHKSRIMCSQCGAQYKSH